jgi:hypothetical protein
VPVIRHLENCLLSILPADLFGRVAESFFGLLLLEYVAYLLVLADGLDLGLIQTLFPILIQDKCINTFLEIF